VGGDVWVGVRSKVDRKACTIRCCIVVDCMEYISCTMETYGNGTTTPGETYSPVLCVQYPKEGNLSFQSTGRTQLVHSAFFRYSTRYESCHQAEAATCAAKCKDRLFSHRRPIITRPWPRAVREAEAAKPPRRGAHKAE
jgi:hypothetical protein